MKLGTAKFSLLVISILLGFSSPVTAELRVPIEVSGATLVACGEIDPTPSVGAQEEEKTVHGYVFVMDAHETPRFKPECEKVTAKIGTQFGIQVQINGAPELQVAPVVTRVTHPPITNPETGKTSTVDQWDSPMNIGYARFAGWHFEDEWELVPGEWRIEILYQNKVLVKQDFKVSAE